MIAYGLAVLWTLELLADRVGRWMGGVRQFVLQNVAVSVGHGPNEGLVRCLAYSWEAAVVCCSHGQGTPECLTGVRGERWAASSQLPEAPADNDGYMHLPSHKQISLVADVMVDPSPDTTPINVIDNLPPEDAIFYSHEDNVVERCGKSASLAREIEQPYRFVGGSEAEYIKYLGLDRAKPLWHWGTTAEVKAYAGIASFLKKDGISQRKLLMQCVANYWFSDTRTRSCLGMGGGSALSQAHAADGAFEVAACDEDSSFTWIENPRWMWRWCCGPPLLAARVSHLLPQQLLDSINDLEIPCFSFAAANDLEASYLPFAAGTLSKSMILRLPTSRLQLLPCLSH
jgi:hypothetical protein